MTCVGEDVGCGAGETGAGLMEGGAAVVTDERSDMGGRRVVTASAVILLRFPGWSRRVRSDANNPAAVSVMLRWRRKLLGSDVGSKNLLMT